MKRFPPPASSRIRPLLERLEARDVPTIVLPAPGAVGLVTMIGTNDADQFVIRAAPTGGIRQMLQFSDDGGRSFQTLPAKAITEVMVLGQAGSDRLTIDHALGFVGRARGLAISYQAGYNGVNELDELVLQGDPGNLVHTTYSAERSGEGRLHVSDDLRSLSIKFSPLASITDTMPGTSLTINGTAGNDLFQILDGVGENVPTTRVAMGGTSLDFANKSKLFIDAGAGDDVFLIDSSTPAAGLFSIVLDGGEGVDGSIHVNDPLVSISLSNIEWSERSK